MPTELDVYGWILDLDGTVVMTQEDHSAAQSEVAKQFGVHIAPADITQQYAGIPAIQMFKTIAPHCNAELMAQAAWTIMHHKVGTEGVKMPRGMYALIRRLSRLGHKLAIASSSPLVWINLVLAKAIPSDEFPHPEPLTTFFGDCVVSGEQCKRPKPYPDVFLAAQEKLKQKGNITKWMGIGDSWVDVQGLLAAGIPCLFLSQDPQFDGNPLVRRFTTSVELCKFANSLLPRQLAS